MIRRELEWHETKACRRHWLDKLIYDPPAFDQVVQTGLDFLNPKPNERILDLGCGEGKETMRFALLGLQVIGVDLSYSQLLLARGRLHQVDARTRVNFVQANAEELPFASGSFRIIYGKAILHHLSLDIAAHEVNRVLEPEGRASFAEPLADHPFFSIARRLSRHLRTPDESPPRFIDLARFAECFAVSEISPRFLFSPLLYPIRLLPAAESIFRKLHWWIGRIDSWLLARFPALSRWAWYGLVNVVAAQTSQPDLVLADEADRARRPTAV